jgi:transposase
VRWVQKHACFSDVFEGFHTLQGHHLIPNIPENPRNRKRPKRGRKRLFNAAVQALRIRVERSFAWEDKFKRLLLRFERIQQRHYGMKLLAYTLINLRAFCGV